MKITLIGPAYPLRGGIAHSNTMLAEALSSRHDTETITFKRQYPSILFPGKTQEETDARPHASAAPRLIDSVNPFNWITIGSLIRDKRPDLLITRFWLPFFGPCFGTIARRARSNGQTRVICVCDNILPHERRPFDIAFTRYAFRAVDGFIVQSGAVERDLNRFWKGAAYRNVPHPIYSQFGKSIATGEARRVLGITASRVLLFFGYIRRYKGLDILLEALSRVPRDMGVHLLVAGEFYDDERTYRNQIQSLNLTDRVTIRSEYIPAEEVTNCFSASDVLVLPYRSATQSGIAQIAFNFNTPIIATDVGGLAEVVREDHTGLIVPPEDPDALARAIVRFYESGRQTMYREHIKKEKLKYSWENMVAGIEELAASFSR